MQRWGRVLANVSLVLASCAVSLLLVNLACRLFESEKEHDAFFEQPSQKKIFIARFRYDPLLGKALTPNDHYIMSKFGVTIDTNSQSMRYHEIGDKKAFRVAIIGDSYAWGWGVEQQDRFSDIIEKRYGYEMLNFGVPGYGPIQYYLELPQVLQFKPDLVIVMFCLDNDFQDNLTSFRYGHYRPYAKLDNGNLTITGYPIPNIEEYNGGMKTVFKNFALGRFLYLHFNDWVNSPAFSSLAPDNEGMTNFHDNVIETDPDSDRAKHAEAINEAVFKMIRDRLAAANVPVIIFADMVPDSEGKSRELEREAKNLRMPFLSSKEPFVPSDFLTHTDRHWTPQGNAKVADIIGPALKTYVDTQHLPGE